MTFYQRLSAVLTPLGIDLAYGAFPDNAALPFAVYLGAGAETFAADDLTYSHGDQWSLEYYFKLKDEVKESTVQQAISEAGFRWEKSEDVYIPDESIYVIYYTLY